MNNSAKLSLTQPLLGKCQKMDSNIVQTLVYGIILGVLIYDNYHSKKLHDTHMMLIMNLSIISLEMHIRLALTDLQLGNISYKTASEIINKSELPEENKNIFLTMLEEITVAYNLNRDV